MAQIIKFYILIKEQPADAGNQIVEVDPVAHLDRTRAMNIVDARNSKRTSQYTDPCWLVQEVSVS